MTRDDARAICEKYALSGVRFTAAQLTLHLSEANGGRGVVDGADCFRLADATIQRLRKAGRIAFTRHGRLPIWSAKLAGALPPAPTTQEDRTHD